MTLLSDTAYHSFIGEVEALNTTTIRRLTRSRRHQLLAIALSPRGTNLFTSITLELSTSSALIISSSADNVTNWSRSYSYPLTTWDFSISSPVVGSCGRSAIPSLRRFDRRARPLSDPLAAVSTQR